MVQLQTQVQRSAGRGRAPAAVQRRAHGRPQGPGPAERRFGQQDVGCRRTLQQQMRTQQEAATTASSTGLRPGAVAQRLARRGQGPAQHAWRRRCSPSRASSSPSTPRCRTWRRPTPPTLPPGTAANPDMVRPVRLAFQAPACRPCSLPGWTMAANPPPTSPFPQPRAPTPMPPTACRAVGRSRRSACVRPLWDGPPRLHGGQVLARHHRVRPGHPELPRRFARRKRVLLPRRDRLPRRQVRRRHQGLRSRCRPVPRQTRRSRSAHLHKGSACSRSSSATQGIAELRALIQRFPNSPEAAQARTKLNGMGVPSVAKRPS
jgi:hypothetical protein